MSASATKPSGIQMNTKMDNSALKTADVFSVLFRYSILLLLYIITFINITKNSVQFMMYIALFILNFFFVVFLFKDLLSNQAIAKAMFQSPLVFSFGEQYGMLKIFSSIIFLALTMQIVSISIILVVFDYGKSNLNNYLSYEMTPPNMARLQQFKRMILWSTMAIAALAFIMILHCAEGRVKGLTYNVMSAALSIVVLVLASIGIYESVEFLKVKQKGQQLYQ